jgi:uncharacterized membrane protein
MALATYRILANEYDAEADAIADYEAIHKLYSDLGILDSFDAAVLTRQSDGKVIIVKRVDEQPKGKARWVSGLAVGTAVALFPAVALGIPVVGLGMGLLAGAGMGAVIGGHVARGMKRSDLKDLGELLDHGTSGLLVVTTTDIEARVEAAITRAHKRAKAKLQADNDAIKEEIGRAA